MKRLKKNDKKPKIPVPTVLRLSVYRRCLQDFKETSTLSFISSKELGKLANRNAAIVRKDLSYFGEYGVPGKGYEVDQLLNRIVAIMNLSDAHRVVLVGVGNLGRALMGYPGFKKQGFKFAAAFDKDPQKIGRKIADIKIKGIGGLRSEVRRQEIRIGALAVPAHAAQETANLMVEAGIKAIINFTPVGIWAPAKVVVRNVDLTRELEIASYFLGA
ncbi:redox-sensing transcriptional repressor Rex [Candidatus Margulisiibacteriota bacterium]